MSGRGHPDDRPSAEPAPPPSRDFNVDWGQLPDAPTELETSIIKFGGSGRRRWLLGLTGVLLVVGGVWALGSTDSDRSNRPEQTPLFQGPGNEATESGAAARAADRRAASQEPEIILVLSPLEAGSAVRLQRTPSRRQPWWAEERLPDLTGLAVDSSGRWLAALDGDRLLIGAVDGRLEEVAADVSSYVWHDTQPGQLAAVVDGDQLQLFHATPTPSRRPTWPDIAGGRLLGWGDWGVLTTGSDDGYVLWPAAGGRTEGPEPAVGMLPGVRLALQSDGSGPPEVVGTEDGELAALPWLLDGVELGRIVLGGTGPRTAVQLSEGPGHPGRVIIVDADLEVVAVVPDSHHVGAMTWTDNGSRLLLVREDPATGVTLIRFDPDQVSSERWPLPGLDPGSHTAEAVALVPGR